jgi:hypothetical protein
MRKICVSFITCCVLLGCFSSEDTDVGLNLLKVRETYPNAVIVPGEKFQYVATDKYGDVHYLKMMRTLKEGITMDVILIRAKR